MLTLTNQLTIEGFRVFRDDQSKTQFYVEPGQPAIAMDGGKPIFSLIVYRRDEARIDPATSPKDDVGGGILTFTVELAVPDEKFRTIQSKLRSIVYGDSSTDASQDVQLSYVDFFDGTVSVAVAGEGTADASGHQFVTSAVGNGKIAGVADNRKAIMVKLTQDGAALMSQIEKLRTLPINVQYSLQFEHRLSGVILHVWCDVSSSYTLVQSTYHEEHEEDSGFLGWSHNDVRTDKVTSAVETMISNRTAGVEVTPGSSQITQDTLDSLAKFGEDMLSKQLEKVVDAKPPPDSMDRTYLDNYATSVNSDLNFTLDEKMVLVQNYTPSANINNIFQRADAQSLVAYVDLRTAFFSVLQVPIRVNADFSALPITHVVVTVTFRSRRPDGVAEDTVKSFDFVDGSTLQTFITYANSLKEVSYDWTATVHYKDSQDPFVFTKGGETANFLVVDVGTLGLMAVDIGLGLVDLTSFPAASVSLRYQSRALGHVVEETFKLDKDHQTASWAAIIREESSGSYEYKVDWLRASDKSIISGEWTSSSSLRLKLDAPIPDHLSVSVISSGNFKDGAEPIIHVGVSLHYTDPDNGYTQDGTLDFTDEKQIQAWSVDLRNPQLRDYQYNYSIVYKGGLVKKVPPDGGWLKGQPGFLVVGEKYGLEVTLYPMLLEYGDNDRVVQVDLKYSDDANHINAVDSFVFNKDQNSSKTWRVRTADTPATLNYSADITYFSTAGKTTKAPTRVTDSDTLVIPPVLSVQASTSPTT